MNVTKKALQSTFLKKTLLDTKYFQFLKIKLEYVLLIPMGWREWAEVVFVFLFLLVFS